MLPIILAIMGKSGEHTYTFQSSSESFQLENQGYLWGQLWQGFKGKSSS